MEAKKQPMILLIDYVPYVAEGHLEETIDSAQEQLG